MFDKRLQYISQGKDSRSQFDAIYRALDAGGDWIQLRYKNVLDMKATGLAERVKQLCERYHATFIVNDFPDLAKEVDADGVHVGLADQSVAEVRRILGTDKIIGGTANTYEDVLLRVKEKCSYIGLGPYRFTTTKSKLSPILGIQGYEQILSRLADGHEGIPIYAIGGIGIEDIAAIRAIKIHGVAVSRLITAAENTREKIKMINDILYGKIENSR